MQIAKEVFDAFTQGSNQCCKSWLFLQRIGLNLGVGGGRRRQALSPKYINRQLIPPRNSQPHSLGYQSHHTSQV